jgi:glycerol-3-phosphate dehydrogenase
VSEDVYDIAIIGGGINGCGIARDAAGRGLRVFLCEQGDLASGTSSASTKLIHGGLRYLEHLEFRLVREALVEREVLWSIAPHIISPMRFVLPHREGLRPAWVLRLGLLLYDHIGGRKLLPPTRTIDFDRDPTGIPLKRGEFSRGFEYSDCWVDDARLVVLNARDAADRGATITTRTKLLSGERKATLWRLQLEDCARQKRTTVAAKIVVNAAGPWVHQVLHSLNVTIDAKVRLVQGSHIVVPKLFEHDRGYIFQNGDGRVLFALPYERDFTLVGTTDQDYVGDPALVRASAEEVAYICKSASRYFARTVTQRDVVWTYSGVRALYDDGESAPQSASRDYVLSLNAPAEAAPLLSIFGGKLTTYRKLAEQALSLLAAKLPSLRRRAGWTSRSPLPGGDFPVGGLKAYLDRLCAEQSWLPRSLAHRLARSYGTRAERVVADAERMGDMGCVFGADLSAREVHYLVSQEWARTSEDVLWRRSKLGLCLDPNETRDLSAYLEAIDGADMTARSAFVTPSVAHVGR